MSNWLRIESESKCKLANRNRIQFVSIPSPKYCSITSVTLFRCHTWTQDFKGSILSIICFFFFLYLSLPGTPCMSWGERWHAQGAEDQRVAWSQRHVYVSVCQIPGIHYSSSSCPSAWSTHTAQHTSSCTETNMPQSLNFSTHTHKKIGNWNPYLCFAHMGAGLCRQ